MRSPNCEKPAKASIQRPSIEGLALPDGEDLPAAGSKLATNAFVPVNILLEFSGPELDARFWHVRELTAPVPVPKAAMDKNGYAIAGQNDVWSAWQVAAMKSKTVAETME